MHQSCVDSDTDSDSDSDGGVQLTPEEMSHPREFDDIARLAIARAIVIAEPKDDMGWIKMSKVCARLPRVNKQVRYSAFGIFTGFRQMLDYSGVAETKRSSQQNRNGDYPVMVRLKDSKEVKELLAAG